MPWSNLTRPVGTRRQFDQLMKKGQTWSGFLIPTLAFLLGFFKDNLASADGLLFPVALSWICFIMTMELADYGELIWHAIFNDFVYHIGAIILFAGIFSYVFSLGSAGAFVWILLTPILFYVIMLIFSPIRNAIVIYRQQL